MCLLCVKNQLKLATTQPSTQANTGSRPPCKQDCLQEQYISLRKRSLPARAYRRSPQTLKSHIRYKVLASVNSKTLYANGWSSQNIINKVIKLLSFNRHVFDYTHTILKVVSQIERNQIQRFHILQFF